jgi:tetratricopeptide (TPR) repeat protein
MLLKRLITGLPLGLSIVAMAIAGGALYFSLQPEEPNTLRLDEGGETSEVEAGERSITLDALDAAALLDRTERIQEEARNASNAANVILGFIESGSILLGALIALAVVVFGLSIQEVRNRLDTSIVDAQSRLKTTEDRLEDLVKDIQAQVAASIQGGELRLLANEDRMKGLQDRIAASIDETDSTVRNLHSIVHEAVESAKTEAENAFRVLSLLLLAEQQVRARNRTTALATLEEAYQIDPNNQITNYLLGYLYVGRKDFDKAVDHLEQALKIDANFAPALAAMGLAQRRMGDAMTEPEDEMKKRQLWAQAELNLNKALEADPSLIDADNESYFGSLGGLYRRQGRNQDALKAYESAVKVTPTSSYPVGNLATLYKKLGYDDDAGRMYERATEISEAILDDHPGDTWARLDLAQALLVRGDTQHAMEQYRNVIDRINEPGPLESAYSGLRFLMDAPTPISGLVEAMNLLTQSITRLQRQRV